MRLSALYVWVDQLLANVDQVRTDELSTPCRWVDQRVQMSLLALYRWLFSCVQMSWSVTYRWGNQLRTDELTSRLQMSLWATCRWVEYHRADELISYVQMSWSALYRWVEFCTWFRRQHCYHHRGQLFRRSPGEQRKARRIRVGNRADRLCTSILRWSPVYVESPTLKLPSADTHAES